MNANNRIEFTKVNRDRNGNPRYVCHFLNFLTDNDFKAPKAMTETEGAEYVRLMKTTVYAYKLAVKKANKIGGKKYRGKDFAGGIVFQSFNIFDTEKSIVELLTPKN